MCRLIFAILSGAFIGILSGAFMGVLIGLPISFLVWLKYGGDFLTFFKWTTLGFLVLGFAGGLNTVFSGTTKPETDEEQKDGWNFFEKSISKALGQTTESWLNPKTYVKPHRRKDGSYVKGYFRRKRQ